jgi:hypothetical protein
MVNQRLQTALKSHTVLTLRKEVSKARMNIGGVSKMKKAQLINHMLKTPSLYSHIKMRQKTKTTRRKKAPPRPPRPDALGLANFGLGLSGGMMSRAQINKRLGQAMKNAYKRSH